MRLSEAIRLGSMLKPQFIDGYQRRIPLTLFGYDAGYRVVGTCALGAALDAVGALRPRPHQCDAELAHRWPWLFHVTNGTSAWTKITVLNDDRGWTREQIADFVATIEPERQQAIEDAPATNAVAEATDSPVLTPRA